MESMSQSSSESLQFSINESVWLRDDTPAEEILSMALEPDITVEENWNDVTIKGFLRLTGEYKPTNISEGAVDEKTAAPFRTIDEIMETTSGTAVLEHHFPIDITIPADRVPNLEELFVVIESFDYELSEHRHIQLQADIAITGLTNQNRSEKKVKPVGPVGKPEAAAPAPVNEKPAPPAEKKKAAVEPKTKKTAVEPKMKKAEKALQKPEKAESPQENVTEAVEKVKKTAPKAQAPAGKGKVQEKAKKAQKRVDEQEENEKLQQLPEEIEDYSDDFDPMPTDRQIEDDEDEEIEAFQYEAFHRPESTEESTPQVAFGRMDGGAAGNYAAGRYAYTPPAPSETIQTGETDSAPQDEKQDSRPEEANSLYLTKVLAGSEAQQQTKVKICIVQSGESLESISERYQVPVTSLLRRNELVSAAIEAGQILYIPKSAKGSKNE